MGYLIGNIIGRFIASILLVWIILFLFNKFDASQANTKLKRPLSIVGVFVLFAIGMLGTLSQTI